MERLRKNNQTGQILELELDEDETADARNQVEGLRGKLGILDSALPSRATPFCTSPPFSFTKMPKSKFQNNRISELILTRLPAFPTAE